MPPPNTTYKTFILADERFTVGDSVMIKVSCLLRVCSPRINLDRWTFEVALSISLARGAAVVLGGSFLAWLLR